jgi:excisionase family DNA binding protein
LRKASTAHEDNAVKIFYTVAEAKDALGIGTTRLYELLTSGRLRARKLGNTTLIEAESMQELVKSLPLGKFTTHAKQIASRSQNLRPRLEEDGPSAT